MWYNTGMGSRVLLRSWNALRPVLTSQTLHKLVGTQRCQRLHHHSSPISPLVQQIARISTTSPKRDTCSFHVQDDEDFQKRVLENDKPVVVDFHATWCGPCKILAPTLEKKIANWKGDVLLAKVDIDEQELEDTVKTYEIQAVPTVIAIKNGKVQNKFMGVLDEDQLESFIEKHVGRAPPE